ncbi:hypothetical protein PG993_009692 [Apiospora rasikravindrae]|uniref:Uncharacterized protein n=1 Tax=Apiospora rasikravindrae TaxID=990691 RepID=A0ABR1SK31_9PEZI
MFYFTLISLKNTLSAGIQRISDSLFLNDDKSLESLPEPYIPSATASEQHAAGEGNNKTMASSNHETLREKASKKLHGPDANPSMLGDPISLKAESSQTNPTLDEAGAGRSPSSSSPSPSSSEARDKENKQNGNSRGEETLREKAAKQLKGPDANPSQLGDPISLKNETSDHMPKPDEAGARHRESKL